MQNKLYNINIDISKPTPSDLIHEFKFEEAGIIISKYYDYRMEKNPLYMEVLKNAHKITEQDLQNSKFYRHPNISITRDKFNVLKEKYNASVVLSKDTCDYEIVSVKTIDSMVKNSDYSRYKTKSQIIKALNHAKKLFSEGVLENLISVINSQADKSMFDLDLRYEYNYNHPAKDSLVSNIYDSLYTSYKIITEEDLKSLMSMINRGNIVFDTEIHPFINKHLYVLTDDDFYSIEKMLKSTVDDKELALGMMANADVDQSYDKIALLLYFYNNNMKECKTWNSSNFKNIRKQFSDFISNASLSFVHTYDYVIQKLALQNKLTEFSVNILLKLFFEHVSSSILGKDHVFTVDFEAIKLAGDYRKKVKS